MSRAKLCVGRVWSAMRAWSSQGAPHTPCGNPSYALNATAVASRIRPDGGGGLGRLHARPRPTRRLSKATVGFAAPGTREPRRCATVRPSWDAATFAAGGARTPPPPLSPPRPRGVTRPRLLAPRRLPTWAPLNEPERTASPAALGWPINGPGLARAPARKRLATAASDGCRATARRGSFSEVPPDFRKADLAPLLIGNEAAVKARARRRGVFPAGNGDKDFISSRAASALGKPFHPGRGPVLSSIRGGLMALLLPGKQWTDDGFSQGRLARRCGPRNENTALGTVGIPTGLRGPMATPHGGVPRCLGLLTTEEFHSMGLPYWLVRTHAWACP